MSKLNPIVKDVGAANISCRWLDQLLEPSKYVLKYVGHTSPLILINIM